MLLLMLVVLIVAKCIVNDYCKLNIIDVLTVLIVAKCIVNSGLVGLSPNSRRY